MCNVKKKNDPHSREYTNLRYATSGFEPAQNLRSGLVE